ncbi:MAG: PAS domain-containing protein [Bdellovibrionales bacterium]
MFGSCLLHSAFAETHLHHSGHAATVPVESAASTSSLSTSWLSTFSQADFMPHGHCYLWQPALVWTHVISDLLIGIAYVSISFILYLLVRKIRLPFTLVVMCFGVFIGACGLTHFLETWNLWHADYWVAGFVKATTAIASVGTGVYLFRLRHPIVTVAEAAKLSEQRRLDLEALTKDLETRVQERTRQLNESRLEIIDVINALPSGVIQFELDFRYRMVNKLFEQWFGLQRKDVIGRHISEILGADSFEFLRPYLERAKNGESVQFSMQNYNPQQGLRYVDISYIPRFVDGSVESIIALVTDRTNEHESNLKMEKLATESERDRAQLAAVFNAVRDGIVVVDPQGQFLFFNEALAQISGFPDAASMRRDFEYFKGVFELSSLDGKKLPVEQWPLSRVLRGEGISNVELYARRTDLGTEWVYSFSGQPVFDDSGKQILSVVVSRDITVQKRHEMAHLQGLEQFKTLANAIPQMAWMAHPDGGIFWFNDEWFQYTGLSLSESDGWQWTQSVQPEHRDLVTSQWKSHIRDARPFEVEFPLRSKTGAYRWFLVRVRPLQDPNGRVWRWFGTSTDIDDQKRVNNLLMMAKEQAEAASAAKSRFLANMSHELRTPLTAVLGFTDLIRDPQLSVPERQDALNRIERSGRTLLRLIDDVLDISKIEAGKIPVQKSLFSPRDLVQDVLSLFALQADEKGVKLIPEILDGVPARACTDGSRLRQILTNLLANAIKFTDQGEIRLQVSAEITADPQNQVLVFRVVDTGIGMRPEDQSRIFFPFAQADGSITRRFGGSGLGLVLSRRLAELLGGSLELEKSVPNQGSTFVAKIEASPFHYDGPRSREGAPSELGTQANHEATELARARILLVEDVLDNQILMKKFLEQAQAHVDLAENGVEALQKISSTSYDLILMDIQLPVLDGIQATQILRQRGFQKPIIALTAHALPEEVHRSHLAGCNEHLTKPISRLDLIEAILRWLPR